MTMETSNSTGGRQRRNVTPQIDEWQVLQMHCVVRLCTDHCSWQNTTKEIATHFFQHSQDTHQSSEPDKFYQGERLQRRSIACFLSRLARVDEYSFMSTLNGSISGLLYLFISQNRRRDRSVVPVPYSRSLTQREQDSGKYKIFQRMLLLVYWLACDL